MNILPTHPKYAGERYFLDMARLHCDAAYTAFYAQARRDVFHGRTGENYRRFVRMAHERNLPAAIQIQSTLANLEDLDAAEAQHAVDNTPCVFHASNVDDRLVCFASFASEAWKRLLAEFTEFFVRECGFDWVVYEEPMFAVDIPGAKDRFHAEFRRRYPDAPYPARHEESPSYVKVQYLKKEVLAGFYRDLLDGAKAAGAKKCGVMPWFFTPIFENTPYETFETACDLGRIIHLDSLDFVVVRMQPDNVYAGATAPVPTHEAGARLYYTEAMAHALGKPVICVNNAMNEHREWFAFDAIPMDFFRAATLSALATAPEGMTHHWYVPRDLPVIEPHLEFLGRANEATRRLGRPQCSVAFVYSYRGTSHAWPLRHSEIFDRYWAFARQMAFEAGPLMPTGDRVEPAGRIPFKVFYADTLARSLECNPEVRLLVLDEYHPLSDEETRLVARWIDEAPPESPRAALVFASGYGYSASADRAGDDELHRAWPALLELCGFDSEWPARPRILNRSRRLKPVAPLKRLPPTLRQPGGAYIFRLLDARLRPGTEVLVEEDIENLPWLVMRPARGGQDSEKTRADKEKAKGGVWTLCSGLWPRTLPPVAPIVRHILAEIGARPPEIVAGEGVLWNLAANGYLIATNPTASDSHIDLAETGARYWDTRARQFISTTRAAIAAYDFLLARRLLDGQRVLDVEGAQITRLDDSPGASSSRIEMDSPGARVRIHVIRPPRNIRVEIPGQSSQSARLHADSGPNSNRKSSLNSGPDSSLNSGPAVSSPIDLDLPPGPAAIVLEWEA